MLIAQISDTHICGLDDKTYGVAPMVEHLRLCIDHINHSNPTPDVVLITGDIASDGSVLDYVKAKELLNQLSVPYFVVPGNHDDRIHFKKAFYQSALPKTNQSTYYQYVIDAYKIRLIALDTTRPNQSGGELCAQRLEWLQKRLAENTQKPTVIFMHHPPINLGVRETDIDGFIGKQEFNEIIQGYDNILQVMCGHVHLATSNSLNNTVISTAPSIGMELVIDLNLDNESKFFLSKPEYQLHHWNGQKNLITYTVKVNHQHEQHLFGAA